MNKGWLIHTKCNNPNHSENIHSLKPNECGTLEDTEMFPNHDFVGHTYGPDCICSPTLEDGMLIHTALDNRD